MWTKSSGLGSRASFPFFWGGERGVEQKKIEGEGKRVSWRVHEERTLFWFFNHSSLGECSLVNAFESSFCGGIISVSRFTLFIFLLLSKFQV